MAENLVVPGTNRVDPYQKHLQAPLPRIEGALLSVAARCAESGDTKLAETLQAIADELHHWL